MDLSVCVVIVTYNRLNDLKVTLEKYEEQTFKPASLIVVNNASKDGTYEFVEEWRKGEGAFNRIVVHSSVNRGGAGGFSMGIQEAMKSEQEFIFLSDDDAFPKKDMIEKLLTYYNLMREKNNIAALCTSVMDHQGINKGHRARIKKGLLSIRRISIPVEEYKKPFFDIDILTFVGALIKKETIQKIGLPLEEYFIHEDDIEYSTRIRKVGRIVCVPSSVMIHPSLGEAEREWIEYYTTRNYVNYIGRHYPRRYQIFAELEKYVKKSSFVAAVVKKRSRAYRAMNKIAIRDGRIGKLGISNQYKPGQVISKNKGKS